ncbi:MAG: phytoene/squalene synthase family protein [Beijerinckiaceae bacterium]
MTAPVGGLAAAFAACEASLREGSDADRDAWLASLFIPADARPAVQALYAFAREIARVPDIVSQAALGEIRLQWWVEALEGSRAAEAASHPVAAALFDTVGRYSLPRPALIALIEAHRFDLYSDPMPSLNDLEGYCGETAACLMRLASIVVAGGRDPGGAAAAGHAGAALGMARVLAGLPAQAARSQCFIPRDVLARHGALPEAVAAGLASPALDAALAEMRQIARAHAARAWASIQDMEAGARAALLPLALVEPMLKRMERRGFDPFRDRAEPAQWRRQWALWNAARRL